jgi:hypothetical protein
LPDASSKINELQGQKSSTSIRCIDKENKDAKESESETHQQEATHNHDPSVHQYTHAGRQEDKRKTTQKSKQAQHFIKAKYLQRVQSSLTDFEAKYERVCYIKRK